MWKEHLRKEDEHLRRSSASLVIREMQIHATRGHLHTPSKQGSCLDYDLCLQASPSGRAAGDPE